MALFAGLLVCLTLWWLSRNSGGLGRRLRRAAGQGLGAALGRTTLPTFGAFALLAAGFLLLHGNFVLAALLGLSGVWMIEGQVAMTARLSRVIRRRAGLDRPYRTHLIEAQLNPDGSLRDGRVLAGPDVGAWLNALPAEAVVDFLRLCRRSDAAGAALLEPYLDRRAPGWRVDAERDGDAGPRRPPNPGAMSQEEAYEILGLQRGATAEEIRAAHRSLMKRAHPDQGGSAERAARVNAARDRLLNRHR
jgi:hypothetical protein